MDITHRRRVEALLAGAAAEHASLMSDLSPELQASVPVDAQGVTHAIDHLATAAGLSLAERRALADVVGGEPLGRAVRRLLVAHPPPVDADGDDVVPALRATYAAQERAAMMIAGVSMTTRARARAGARLLAPGDPGLSGCNGLPGTGCSRI